MSCNGKVLILTQTTFCSNSNPVGVSKPKLFLCLIVVS